MEQSGDDRRKVTCEAIGHGPWPWRSTETRWFIGFAQGRNGPLAPAQYRTQEASLKTLRTPNNVCILPFLFLIVAIHPDAALMAQSADTFTATGRMTTSRLDHTATLLPDGKVLIVGGYAPQDPSPPAVLKTAELYDPTTGTFSATGSMANARYAHSATLLPDGRVLIAGGYSGTNAEFYDSATGRFTSAGNMITSRQWHTATLLNNGTVLIAGGNLDGSYASSYTVGSTSAEVYDPATGIFSATGTMTRYRNSHKAGLLANGNVLTVPGSDASDFTTAEIYDLEAGTFSSVPFAGSGGYSAATENILTNGNALITLQLAECDYGIDLANLFDASTTTFTAASRMVYLHCQQTSATLADGSVLIVGNLLDGIGPLPGAEICDPTSGTFSSTGMMTSASVSPTPPC